MMLKTENVTLKTQAITLLCAVVFLAGNSAFAQENAGALPDLVPEDVRVEGLVDCFDYYRFGSTPIVIEGELREVAQGAATAIEGKITNENSYPLQDVAVYAKVFKKRAADANGPDVVDWLTVADELTLEAGESVPLSFVWDVPYGTEPGEYQIATYAVSSDRFNMLGLSFTDDVVGGIFDFGVVGDDDGAVRFDKAGVTVDSEPFHFAAFPPRVPLGKEIPVTARVLNSTDEDAVATIVWKLYAWDALREEKLIDTSESVIGVDAGGGKDVAFTVSDTLHSVYYLLGELTDDDGAKSIIGVRFVREDISEPRLNFVGVNEYPGSDNAVAFACIHAAGTGPAEGGKLELSIVRSNLASRLLGGGVVSTVYEGVISGEINALTLPLSTRDTSFDIVARLYQKGELVDEVTVPYRCEALGAPCRSDNTKLWIYGIGAAAVFLLIASLLVVRIARRKTYAPEFEAGETM